MNKKLFLAGALASMLVLCVGVLVGVPRLGLDRLRADPIVYHMELTSSTEVVAKENGAYHQVDIRNNKIDIVGYESTSGNTKMSATICSGNVKDISLTEID